MKNIFLSSIFGFWLCLNTNLIAEDSNIANMRSIIAQHGLTDKDSIHNYLGAYSRLLEPFKNEKCSLLEIGVYCGGSAILWHEYLPSSTLFLVDISPTLSSSIKAAMDPSRYHFYLRNAYLPSTAAELQQANPDGFDIIIDDGDHALGSQIFLLKSYLQLLKSGGVLIIEDIQDISHIEILKQNVPAESCFQVETIDLRATKGRYDDLLFIVKKL